MKTENYEKRRAELLPIVETVMTGFDRVGAECFKHRAWGEGSCSCVACNPSEPTTLLVTLAKRLRIDEPLVSGGKLLMRGIGPDGFVYEAASDVRFWRDLHAGLTSSN